MSVLIQSDYADLETVSTLFGDALFSNPRGPHGVAALMDFEQADIEMLADKIISSAHGDKAQTTASVKMLLMILKDQVLKSRTDSLTGLYNSVHFQHMLEQQINLLDAQCDPDNRRTIAHSNGIAVLYIDLDHFKPVNDTYGHAIGDQALQLAARAMTETLREFDIAARVSGDEFAILLTDIDPDSVEAVQQRIQKRFEDLYLEIDDISVKVSASVGVGIYKPGDTGDSLLDRADNNMYAVKQVRSAMRP